MKVAVHTLGCKVNLYESEYIINLFKNLKKDEFSDLDEFETPKKVERKEEKIIEKEPIFEEKEEPKTEEALSKTSMFRVVSVKKEGYEPKESSKVEEETEIEKLKKLLKKI